MTATHAAEAPVETAAPPVERPTPDKRERSNPKRQPQYVVVLHNDDLNTMDYVISVLRKIFHYDLVKAGKPMLQAHHSGRTIVWSGALEVAELKADQIRSAGPDPDMKKFGATALSVSVEPLPG